MYSGPLPTSKIELFVRIVNSIAKRSILDVAGVSGYSERNHMQLATVQMCCPGDAKFLTSKLFLMRKKSQGTGKANNRLA